MVRFSENTPWDFGVTPSEYVQMQQDHLKCTTGGITEIKRKIARQNYSVNYTNGDDNLLLALDFLGGIETLDTLFQMTKRVPPLKIQSPPQSTNTFEFNTTKITQDDQNVIKLILANAKPAGMIEVQDPSLLPPELATLHFDAYLSHPAMQTHQNNYYITKEAAIMHALQFHQEKFKRLEKEHQFGVDSYLHLVHGILFGYPMADVMELNTYYNPLSPLKTKPQTKNLSLLFHKISPELWAKPWNDTIGMAAEVHLNNIYQQVLHESR